MLSDAAYRILSSTFLFVAGLYYLYTYIVAKKRDSCCASSSETASHPLKGSSTPDKSMDGVVVNGNTVNRAAEISLVMMTTLSPCVGSMPVLIAMMKPPLDVTRVALAALVLLAVSASVMMSLAALSFVGAARLDFGKIRRHERLVLGVCLVALAALTFFVLAKHDHTHHTHHHGSAEMQADASRQIKGVVGGVNGGCHRHYR